MINKFSEGSPVEVTVPSGGCVSGRGLLVGTLLFGIAVTTQAAGDLGEIHVNGIFDHASDTGAAWAAGDLLYWDNTAKVFTKTSTSNTKVGVAAAAKLSATATGRVRLVPNLG